MAGRERAVTSAVAAFDDGFLSMAFLRSKGAHRVYSEGLHDSATRDSIHEIAACGYTEAHMEPRQILIVVPCPFETTNDDSEDDPFGHNQLGFDDGPGLADELAWGQTVATPAPGPEQADGGAHASHWLQRVANIVWCSVRGRHAAVRLGTGLRGACRGEATGAYPLRISRLRAGLHPTTGLPVYQSLG